MHFLPDLASLAPSSVDPKQLLGLAIALGVLIRTVVVPLLKALGLFKDLPLPVQTAITVVLACLAGFLERYGLDGSLADALIAAVTAYGAAQVSYGLTAPLLEKRAAPRGIALPKEGPSNVIGRR